MPELEIYLGQSPSDAKILLDGKVVDFVSKVEIEQDCESLPVVRLTVIPGKVSLVTSQLQSLVVEDSEEILVKNTVLTSDHFEKL